MNTLIDHDRTVGPTGNAMPRCPASFNPAKQQALRPLRRRRQGLSLLEVILAIAILGGALAVIGELVRLGSLAAGRAENLSKAQLIADTRMAELSAGALPLQSVSEAPCDEDPDWIYSVNVGEAGRIGLLNVEVVVQQEPTKYVRPLSIKLTRWIADPDFIQEVYDAAEAEETTW